MSGVALITGGSRGVGRACAVALARDGYDIAIGYAVSDQPARDAVTEIEALGRRAIAIKSDLRTEGGVNELTSRALEALGPISVVVSNATGYPAGTTREDLASGVDRSLGPALGAPSERYLEMFQARLIAFHGLARAVVPQMPTGGSIIAIISTGTQGYVPGYGPTGVAMAGVQLLARYLAVELGPKQIRVNVVSGGLIRTDAVSLLTKDIDRFEAAAAAVTPLGRVGEVGDMAEVVSFLAGEGGRWITGQTIVADGGAVLV